MSLRRIALLGFVLIFFILPRGHADETKTDLRVVQGSSNRVITEFDLQQLQLETLEVDDPVYKKRKRYGGYWLTDILALAGKHLDPHSVLTFTALDGDKDSIAVTDMLQSSSKAFVAIEDLDEEEGWEKIQQGKEWISPGPYYLVWQTALEAADSKVKLPWRYEMIEISIYPHADL